MQSANDKDILILISDLISEINKRNQNNAGVKQAIKLLNTSKDRIEKGKETPEAESRALYQTLSSIFLFEQLQFTNQEYKLLKEIEKIAHRKGAKGVDLTDATDEEIQGWATKLNTRPKKCLNWKTPYEIFYKTVLHLI